MSLILRKVAERRKNTRGRATQTATEGNVAKNPQGQQPLTEKQKAQATESSSKVILLVEFS